MATQLEFSANWRKIGPVSISAQAALVTSQYLAEYVEDNDLEDAPTSCIDVDAGVELSYKFTPQGIELTWNESARLTGAQIPMFSIIAYPFKVTNTGGAMGLKFYAQD